MNERRIMRDEYCEGVCVGRVENHKERRRRRVPRIIRFLIIVFVGLVVTRTFADTYSLESVLRGEVPSRDKIYFSHPMLVVQQVVKGGALVRLHHLLSEGCEARVIMLAMDATGLVDDAAMTKRFFRYSGTTTYTTVTGADKTVHLFSQISNDELRSLAEKEEQDRALREAEEKSRAEREQPEREKLIAKLFSKIDFDIGNIIYVDNGLMEDISVKVKHFRWERLQDCQRKADWLAFINEASLLVSGERSDKRPYDKYPDRETIGELFNRFVNADIPVSVSIGSCAEKSRELPVGRRRREGPIIRLFVDDALSRLDDIGMNEAQLKMDACNDADYARKFGAVRREYRKEVFGLGDAACSVYINEQYGDGKLPLLAGGRIYVCCVKSSQVAKQLNELWLLERDAVVRYCQQEISQKSCQEQLSKVKADAEKIKEEGFVPLGKFILPENGRARKEKIQEQRDDEYAKRNKVLKDLLDSLETSPEKVVVFPRFLKKNVLAVGWDEQMRRVVSAKKSDNMLQAYKELQFSQKDVVELPRVERIQTDFDIFKHQNRWIEVRLNGLDLGKYTCVAIAQDGRIVVDGQSCLSVNATEQIGWRLVYDDTHTKYYIMSRDDEFKLSQLYHTQKGKLEKKYAVTGTKSDVRAGLEKYARGVIARLDYLVPIMTTRGLDWGKFMAPLPKDSASSSGKSTLKSDGEDVVECPNCNGKRRVKAEASCPECKGVGSKPTKSYRGLDGRIRPSRNIPCVRCSGKGVLIKTLTCDECHGKGTVPKNE